jgi:hypothetical protein
VRSCCGSGWMLSEEGGAPLSRRRLDAKLFTIEVVRSASTLVEERSREAEGACDRQIEEIPP